MAFDEKLHRNIMKKYKECFEIFEEYDKTGYWPLGRKRIDITLSKRTIKKLKVLKSKTGKPVSRIIEEAVNKI